MQAAILLYVMSMIMRLCLVHFVIVLIAPTVTIQIIMSCSAWFVKKKYVKTVEAIVRIVDIVVQIQAVFDYVCHAKNGAVQAVIR